MHIRNLPLLGYKFRICCLCLSGKFVWVFEHYGENIGGKGVYMKKQADIVLIDSGVNICHPALKNQALKGCTLQLSDDEGIVILEGEFADEEGHGTAVFSILQRLCKDAAIYIIKLSKDDENNESISSMLLQQALKYVDENIDCKIIHLSLGVEYCSHVKEFENVCMQLASRNTIIVSAFSNLGCVSYPAAFSCVLGVDEIRECRHFDEFEYIENSIVNIRIAATAQVLPWGSGGFLKVAGTSFSSPHVTALIYNEINHKNYTIGQIYDFLRKAALNVIKLLDEKTEECFVIKKAIVFPFNKEVHSLVRFSESLSFELQDIYDCKYLGNIGKSVSGLLNDTLETDYIIKDIENLNWEDDFDTVIIGHTEMLESITRKKYALYLLDNCVKHNKNIYMFDDHDKKYQELLENDSINVYLPRITKENVPRRLMGKLYCISIPILCIIGTSSKQGKFTLQNILRKKFLEAGYTVGQLGTEPSSKLYGYKEVFPMGYNSTVEIQGYDCVATVNNMLHNIEEDNPDIIITGTQAETVAASIACVENIPREQSYFLYGVNPDGFVLICNYFDDVEYVLRTIKYAEAINGAQVIAVVIFPVDNDLRWSVLGNKQLVVNEQELVDKKKQIMDVSSKKAYVLGNKGDMQELFEEIESYFQE